MRAITFMLHKLKRERHKICFRSNGKGKSWSSP